MTRHSPALVLLRGAVTGVATAVALHPGSDPDLWGHLRYGLDFWSTHRIPLSDVYSFTSDRAWINHEWLTEALVAAVYSARGAIAIAVLVAAIALVALAVVRWSARRSDVGGWRLELLVFAVFLFGVAPLVQTMRPQAISALMLVTLLAAIREADRGHHRALFVLPLLFLVWANLHGAWVMAGGVLALWIVVRCAQTSSPRGLRVALLATGVASALATFVNPYGLNLWRFLFDTLRVQRTDIVEWGSLVSSPILFVPWTVTVLIGVAAIARTVLARADASPQRAWARGFTRRPELVAYVAVCLLLGAASFRVIRLVPFFSLAVLMLLGPFATTSAAATDALPDASTSSSASKVSDDAARSSSVRTRVGLAAGGVVVWIVCVASSLTSGPGPGCLQASGSFHVDERAASFLRENHVTGRLLVWFDWGEYVTWHFGEALRVSMDGRRETVYSAEFLKAHRDFYQNAPTARAFLTRLSPDYIWLPQSTPVAAAIAGWGWTPIFETDMSTIWARGSLPRSWRPPAPVVTSCFPNA